MNEPLKNERREYVRVGKQLILSYFLPSDPSKKFDLSQMKNVSRGGICFVTTEQYLPMTCLAVELMTPYLTETSHLTGLVIESTEKIPGLLYETRMKFDQLSPVAVAFLEEMINYFLFEEKNEE